MKFLGLAVSAAALTGALAVAAPGSAMAAEGERAVSFEQHGLVLDVRHGDHDRGRRWGHDGHFRGRGHGDRGHRFRHRGHGKHDRHDHWGHRRHHRGSWGSYHDFGHWGYRRPWGYGGFAPGYRWGGFGRGYRDCY